MTPEQIQQERAAFEEWLLSIGKTKAYLVMQINKERYFDELTETAWQGWLYRAKQPAQSAWISVEDRLPNEGEVVIICAPNTLHNPITDREDETHIGEDFMQHGFWVNNQEYYGGWNDTEEELEKHAKAARPSRVTHWQPLPEPPKAA